MPLQFGGAFAVFHVQPLGQHAGAGDVASGIVAGAHEPALRCRGRRSGCAGAARWRREGISMIAALITGTLRCKAERRTSRSGNPYVATRIRVQSGEGSASVVCVVAYAAGVQEALLALDVGEAVAIAGVLSARAWIDRDGVALPALDLIADQVLTVHHAKHKREVLRHSERSAASAPAGAAVDDEGPR
jgi:hypothetical protein